MIMLSLTDYSKCVNTVCSKRFTCLRYMGKPEYQQSYAMYNFVLIDMVCKPINKECDDYIKIKDSDVLEEDKILERNNYNG